MRMARWTLTLLAVLFSLNVLLTQEPPRKKPPPPPGLVEVRFHDDSVMKLQLKEDRLEISTPYGVLQVPVAKIQQLELGMRVSDEMARRIETAIADLASEDVKKREAAVDFLLEQRVRSVPALQAAARNPKEDDGRRAKEVLNKLQEALGEEQMNVRTTDVIHTADSKIVGRISVSVFKVYSEPFGDLSLKVAYVRSMRSVGVEESQPVNVLPDPGNMSNYRHLIGQTFFFRVVGAVQGSAWGTDVYTTDTAIAVAAVHCGVVRPGQTGIVKVQLVQPPPAFQGSARNGVTTSDYGAYGGAYKVLR